MLIFRYPFSSNLLITRLLLGTATKPVWLCKSCWNAALTYLVTLLQRTGNNLIYIKRAIEVIAFVLENDSGETLDAFGGVL